MAKEKHPEQHTSRVSFPASEPAHFTEKKNPAGVINNNRKDESSPSPSPTNTGREFNSNVETPHEIPDDFETDTRPS